MLLNEFIDHTLLKPDASRQMIDTLCAEAIEHRFASVCINPCWARQAVRFCQGTGVKVCSVVGFPLGSMTPKTKIEEAQYLVSLGVEEIDMVLNIGFLKSGYFREVEEEVRAVVEISQPAIVKVILETCLLTDEEKIQACVLCRSAGAHFVKTSTGFSHGGATLADVQLLKKTVGEKLGVKASGGIKDHNMALAMIQAGASRIGTSSGVAIMQSSRNL